MKENIGKVVAIIGPVLDIAFSKDNIPSLLSALRIPASDDKDLIVEVAQHIGDDKVRCIAMGSSDGFKRGDLAYDTFAPISVPVGEEVLGRMFNVLGEPIDQLGEVKAKKRMSIHQDAPTFDEQQTSAEMLETGIKVVDLLCPRSEERDRKSEIGRAHV